MIDFIVTELDYRERRYIAALLYEDQKLAELRIQAADAASPVGNVYRGTVENISKNIGGAFVRIGKDTTAFLPLSKGRTVRGSAPILVQIATEASGLKEAVATENVHLSGQYAVLSRRPGRVSFSKKLTDEQKGIIASWLKGREDDGFHLLVRTNAARAEKAQFLAEVGRLSEQMAAILAAYEKAGSGDLLYSPEPFYVTFLRDTYVRPDRIRSDVPLYAGQLEAYMLLERGAGRTADTRSSRFGAEQVTDTESSRFELGRVTDTESSRFELGRVTDPDSSQLEEERVTDPDSSQLEEERVTDTDPSRRETESGPPVELIERGAGKLTVAELYGLPHELDRLTGRRVWLKSGAFLVIEQTEAFVSIDVNTGRCTRGRIPEETYRKINLEAAEEIARQLRLRNLSGMILVDFISMKSEDHRSELLHVMRKLVRRDHIHTEAVDITPLGILEILRQKVRKPLAEELGLC